MVTVLNYKLRQILDSELRQFVDSKIQKVYCNLQFSWISRIISKPLTVSKKSAMVFSPHQDDETLGCGGMIALKHAQKVLVQVVFLTDGRYGKPKWITKEEIINVRQQEATDALAHLGVTPSSIHFLGYSDNTLNNLEYPQYQQVITNLVELLKSFAPEEVYVPYHQDFHPDHEATYKLVSEAIAISGIEVELFQYPIWILWQKPWLYRFKLPKISTAVRIDIENVQEQKRQAIASYKSQSDMLACDFLHFFHLPYEIFIKN